MINNKIIIGSLSTLVILTSIMSISIPVADAHPHTGIIQTENHSHKPITEIIPLGNGIGIEKTTLILHAPADNILPWGFVEGKIANPAKDYPVIIQFFRNGEMVHVAQVDVDESNDYEYKFRVRNVDDGKIINIFEGDYIVEIFKVINSPINSNYV